MTLGILELLCPSSSVSEELFVVIWSLRLDVVVGTEPLVVVLLCELLMPSGESEVNLSASEDIFVFSSISNDELLVVICSLGFGVEVGTDPLVEGGRSGWLNLDCGGVVNRKGRGVLIALDGDFLRDGIEAPVVAWPWPRPNEECSLTWTNWRTLPNQKQLKYAALCELIK